MNSPLRAWMVVSLALIAAAPALAFDFIVTEYTDDALDLDPGCTVDHCTLREAVIAANAGVDADRILLSAGTYTLSIGGAEENAAASGDLDLLEDVELIGPGAPMTSIEAGDLFRQLHTVDSEATIRVAGITFRHGFGDSFAAALLIGPGTLTVEDCELRDNSGTAAAILLNSSSSVLHMRRSALIGNGGPALALSQPSQAFVENTTMMGAVTLIRLNANGPFASCKHCTLVNSADAAAIFVNAFDGATFQIGNSIVVGTCTYLNGGSVTSLGGNVQSTESTCLLAGANDLGSVTTLDLDLGTVADNGGPTRTHLPGGASLANGNALDATCLATDQRGVARTTDCESGSVERTGTAVPTPIFHDGFLQGDTEAWSATVP